MSTKPDYSYLHRRVGEVAAEIRREDASEPARVRKVETWERAQDAAVRAQKCDAAAELVSYVRACGYDPDVTPVLLALMAAAAAAVARGEDGFIKCPDWLFGLYINNGTEFDIERVARLPYNSTDKKSLSQLAKRQWDFLDQQQKATKIISVRRIPGYKDGKKNIGSQYDVSFVQRLVEIGKRKKQMRGGDEFLRLDRATRAVVAEIPREVRLRCECGAKFDADVTGEDLAAALAGWNDEHQGAGHDALAAGIKTEPSERAGKKTKNRITRRTAALIKLEKDVDALIASELADNATGDDLCELLVEVRALERKIAAAALKRGDVAENLVPHLEDLLKQEERSSKTTRQQDAKSPTSCPPTFSENCENSNKTDDLHSVALLNLKSAQPGEDEPSDSLPLLDASARETYCYVVGGRLIGELRREITWLHAAALNRRQEVSQVEGRWMRETEFKQAHASPPADLTVEFDPVGAEPDPPPLELYDEHGNFHLPANARATVRQIEEARRKRHLE
jgi:hypothetical protein